MSCNLTASPKPDANNIVFLPATQLGVPYNETITISGGTAPYNIIVDPAGFDAFTELGLTISTGSNTITISGTPTAKWSVNFRYFDTTQCDRSILSPRTTGPNGQNWKITAIGFESCSYWNHSTPTGSIFRTRRWAVTPGPWPCGPDLPTPIAGPRLDMFFDSAIALQTKLNDSLQDALIGKIQWSATETGDPLNATPTDPFGRYPDMNNACIPNIYLKGITESCNDHTTLQMLVFNDGCQRFSTSRSIGGGGGIPPVGIGITDANGCTLTVITGALPCIGSLTLGDLPNGILGQPYAQQLPVSGGSGNYDITITNGSLPDGITITSSGYISGITNQISVTFTLSVREKPSNCTCACGSRTYTLFFGPDSRKKTKPNKICYEKENNSQGCN